MKRVEQLDESIRVIASVAIGKDCKIPLINEQEEPYHGRWVLPQGYVKTCEQVPDAARREVKEELRVEVELQGLVGVYDDFISEGTGNTHYLFVCYSGKLVGAANPRPTPEAVDMVWVDPARGSFDSPDVARRTLTDASKLGRRRFRYR
ncbi:MAG: NUDIX hydrolase [Nitrososphaerota archaeon]|nr:NUDIX hydrolase [Nitrososphaerota archaeon]MDG7030717.1 NUDIX hydrolase [Nitrososphaerota archaeon]